MRKSCSSAVARASSSRSIRTRSAGEPRPAVAAIRSNTSSTSMQLQRGARRAGERSGITDCRRADADSSLPRLARQERDGDLDLRGREPLKQDRELADFDQAAAGLRNRRTRHDELMKEHP